ncbi:MAG: hypothetical protein AAGI27_17720 [Pseudomonadota bacterium]
MTIIPSLVTGMSGADKPLADAALRADAPESTIVAINELIFLVLLSADIVLCADTCSDVTRHAAATTAVNCVVRMNPPED